MLDTDDVRTLVDVGFIALSRGLDQHAAAIFEGVRAARPEAEAGPLGLALVHLLRGEVDPAVRLLRALPPSDAALTYLGIALLRQGAAQEARALLGDVAATADGPFARLAEDTLAAIGGER